MAAIEKLVKSLDTLKNLQVSPQVSDELSARRRDKIASCVSIADTLCNTSLKSSPNMPSLLTHSIQSLLQLCDDDDSNVHMVAEESLNRIIRAVTDNNIVKIQLELHKEIKKNGNPRSLRAALWRFAQLSHLIKPQRGKAHVANLVPCLVQISSRQEEAVQETLAASLPLILKSLGMFTTDKDIKELLKAFLQNLSSKVPPIRRTAASCIICICRSSRKPQEFLSYVVTTLLDFISIQEGQTVSEVLGVLGCLRAVLPAIDNNQSATPDYGSLGRHGIYKSRLDVNAYVKILELSLHFTRHADHNVVNAALELLLLVLQSPPNELMPLLLSPHGISKMHMSSMCEEKGFSMRSLSQLSVATSGVAGDDSTLPDLDETCSVYSEASTVAPWMQYSSIIRTESEGTPGRPQLQLISVPDQSLRSDLSTDTVPDIESDSLPGLPLLTQVSLDYEPEPETPPPSVGASFGSLTASPSASSQGDVRYQVCDIGSLTDGSVPLVFCARHIATSYLLTGYPGYWIPDRAVRVSVKALALSCIAAIVRLLPNTFQLYLDRDPGLSGCNSPSQPMSDLLLYANHSDPQLRAVCRSLISCLVRAVLVQSGGDWSSWQKKADYTVSPLLSLDRLMDLLLQGFKDESSTTCRITLAAVTPTLPVLLESRDRSAALPLLYALPELAKNPYWLVKVKLAELLQELPMLAMQEAVGLELQNQLIEDTLLVLVGDEDNRVRKAAAEAFVKLIHLLFYPVDHEGRDFILAKAFHLVDVQLGPFLLDSTRLSNLTMGPLDNLVPPFDAWSNHILSREKSKMHRIREAVLARIVHLLTNTLYKCSDKFLTLGCCEALSALATEYSPTVYQLAWGCSLGNSRSATRRDRKKSADSSLPYNRTLGVTMSLLLSSPIAVELSAQHQLLTLSGNILCGCSVAALNANSSQQWSLFKDKQLSIFAENLLGHVMRILKILVHVVDDAGVLSSTSKSSLASFPMGQSLSPIKRHGSTVSSKSVSSSSFDSGIDGKSNKGLSPMKTASNHGEKEEKSEEKKGKVPPMGAFSHLPHYMKIYDIVKSAYSAYKVSLATEANEKLEGIVRATLTTLSSLLEVMNVMEAEKVAEEILTYLRSIMCLAPEHTVGCVNQLLKCLVGMNLSSLWAEIVSSFDTNGDTNGFFDPPDHSKEIFKNGKSFYQICFQEPALKMERFLQSILSKNEEAPNEGNYLKWMNMNRRLSDSKLNPTGGHSTDMTYLASYIRLFEPMVIESMQQYRVTNNVNLQSKILTLLTQLVNLRINYCLLDSEMIFINHIHKQFEWIEEGKVPQASELVSKIFHFLVLLSFEKHHSKSITTIPSVIQLCDTLMASEQDPLTHCIPALIPVVEYVFLSRYVADLSIDSNELETQRDVLVARLLRLIEYYQVMELLSVVLNASRLWPDGEERWIRWSSQVAESLFPMLAERRLRLDSHQALRALHNLLLHSMNPSTRRPVDPLLKVLFAPPPSSDCGVLSTIRWLGGVNVALLTLLAEGREATTLARLDELKLVIHSGLGHATTADLVSPNPLRCGTIADETETTLPQLLIARLLIRVAGLAAERVASLVLDPAASPEVLNQCQLLQQLVAHFLLTIIHMLQSGSYCQIITAAIQLVSNPTTEDALLLEDANATVLQLAPVSPILVVLWCTMLTLVSYGNAAFWTRALQPDSDDEGESPSQSINRKIVQSAATVVYCDYVYENPGETEQLVWLLSCHAFRLVSLSSEPPVHELIAAAHRNEHNSKLFIEAVSNVVSCFSKASVFNRLLLCLESSHPAHSGHLLRLFVNHLIWHPHAALARRAALLCTTRAEYLSTLPPDQVSSQISRQHLIQILEILQCAHHHRKHSALINFVSKLGSQCYSLPQMSLERNNEPSTTAIATDTGTVASSVHRSPITLDKTWYLGQVALRCSGTVYAVEESVLLVGKLEFEDAVNILSSPDTPLSILQHCFWHGVYLTLQGGNEENTSQTNSERSSPLYRASKSVLLKLLRQFKEKVSISRQALSNADTPFRRCDKESLFQLAGATIWYLKTLPLLNQSVPLEAAEDLAHLAIKCLEAVGSDEERASHLQISLECADRIIGVPTLSKCLEDPARSDWLVSACSNLSKLVKTFVYGGSVPTVPDGGLAESLATRGQIDAATACLSMSSLIVWLEKSQQNRATQNIPKFLRSIFKSIIIRLCRIQSLFINSFVCVPPDAWRHGWTVTFEESMTYVPPVPATYLQDMDILQQFIFRVTSLGWKNRLQFEETWMSLLIVLGTPPPEEDTSLDELTLIAQTKTVALQAISALLLQTLFVPVPGDPNGGQLLHIPRDQPLHPNDDRSPPRSKHADWLESEYLLCFSDVTKLKMVQQQLVWKAESLEGIRAYTVFNRPNLERILDPEKLSFSQVSVEYLRCGTARSQPGGVSSSKDVFSEHVILAHDTRERHLQEIGLDLNSCLHFLLELFNQWTQPLVSTGVGSLALQPQCDALRAAITVSDLFTEYNQWEWLLQCALTLASHSADDETLHQYVVLALCKACSVIESSTESLERVRRALESALRSPSVSTRCAAIHGLLYLLQAELLNSFRSQDVSPSEPEQNSSKSEHKSAIVNLATNYVVKHTKTALSIDETHTALVWVLALHLLDNISCFQTEILNQAAPSLVQQATTLAGLNSNSGASSCLQRIIIEGLERVVVSKSKALTDGLFKQVTNLSVECLTDVGPCDLLPTLQLFLSCMYIGMNRKSSGAQQNIGLSNKDRSDSDLAEKLFAAMEKTSVLFERIKKGYPFEVELVCAVLPSLLTDFFPASEVLTKVIGEFLSQQQPHPRLLAGVVFQVFERAVAQNQLALLQDWVVISLANFTQSLPLPMASWCLTCFFISASCNPWLRALFPHVQSRIGRCETEDKKLLCLAAADFYHQLSETQKTTFVATFQAAVENQPNSPFCALIAGL